MPKLRTETYGAGDQSWLGSAHGIWNCRTVTLDISAFTEATHYPDGYIPSGTALAIVGDLAVPFNSAGVDGSEVLAGFLFTDAKVYPGLTEDIPAPLLDHGRVKTANLPLAWTAPTSAANNATTVVFI